MSLFSIGGSFVETLLILITGFTILGINWREVFARLFFISLCIGILGVLATEFPPAIYLPVLFLIICSFLYLMINVKFLFGLAAFVFGSVTYLAIQTIIFSIFPQLTDDFIYPINLVIGVLVIFLIGKYRSNFPMPKKIILNPNSNNPFCTKFKWILYLITLFLCYLALFYSINFSNQEEHIYLAIGSIIFLIVGVYMVKQRYDGQFKFIESFNDEHVQQLNQYVELISSQRLKTVDHFLTLRNMLQIGQLQRARDYLDELIDEATLTRDVASIESSITAGVLLAFKDYARQKDIVLTYDIQDDLSELPCSSYETHHLLKSLLQLIIDTSERVPVNKRKIEFKISKIDNHFSIEIYHPAVIDTRNNPEISENVEVQITDNVKRIVEKYQGHINASFIQDYMHVKVNIPIKN